MSTVLVDLKQRSDSSSDSTSDKFKEEIPELGTPVDQYAGIRGIFHKANDRHPEAIATQPSVFDNPSTLEAYRPPAEYENQHRFDPFARWTWGEEKVRSSLFCIRPWLMTLPVQSVVRKMDSRVMLWAFLMFFSLDLDRSNISQVSNMYLRSLVLIN
jgi:hypothetical protein